jgi:hypothetical protein
LQAFVEHIATLPYGTLPSPQRSSLGFPYGCADSAAADGRRGSNMYEVNPWLWQFWRGKPRLGGLTVKKTTERKKALCKAQVWMGNSAESHGG